MTYLTKADAQSVLAKSKRILAAVDIYHERPDRMNRTALLFLITDMLAADADAYAQGRYDEEMRQGPPQSVWDGLAADAPEQEPVAEIVSDANGTLSTQWNPEWTPNAGDKLYTAAPPAPQARELSDEDIDERLAEMAAMAVWEDEP